MNRKPLALIVLGILALLLGAPRTGNAQPGTFTLSNNAPICDTNPPVGPAVRLNWTTSSGATSYAVYRGGILYMSVGTNLTFYNSLNLVAGQSYSYFVRASNSAGTRDSNTINVSIPSNICAPPPCGATLGSPASNASITLPQSFSWQATNCPTLYLAFATSTAPSALHYTLQTSPFVLTEFFWINVTNWIGTAPTYYWTVGQHNGSTFTPAASWRSFTVASSPPTGACCTNGTTCNVVTQGNCAGVWYGAGTTSCPSSCQPPVTGACCTNGTTCNVVTQGNCAGVWYGAGTTSCPSSCQPPPVTGACCTNGSTCDVVTQSACAGVWYGAGTTNCPNCPAGPTGACCTNASTCFTGVTQPSCVNQGGVWQGPGTTCSSNCSCSLQVSGLIMRLPWTTGDSWPVTQGYCGIPTHTGFAVDFGLPLGTDVLAVAPGKVIQVGYHPNQCPSGGCGGIADNGTFVRIQHTVPGPVPVYYNSVYLHLSEKYVNCGDTPGLNGRPLLIGKSGNSGYTYGPNGGYHLHFEIKRSEYDQNPSDCQLPTVHDGVRPVPMAGQVEHVLQQTVITDFVQGTRYTAIEPGSAGGPTCYPNCDGSTTTPILTANDFACFVSRIAAGESYANCDLSATPPVLNILDFQCFITAYAAGCP